MNLKKQALLAFKIRYCRAILRSGVGTTFQKSVNRISKHAIYAHYFTFITHYAA